MKQSDYNVNGKQIIIIYWSIWKYVWVESRRTR